MPAPTWKRFFSLPTCLNFGLNDSFRCFIDLTLPNMISSRLRLAPSTQKAHPKAIASLSRWGIRSARGGLFAIRESSSAATKSESRFVAHEALRLPSHGRRSADVLASGRVPLLVAPPVGPRSDEGRPHRDSLEPRRARERSTGRHRRRRQGGRLRRSRRRR